MVWGDIIRGDQRLHAFNEDTGAVIFSGGGANELMTGTHRFNTAIVARGRIYVANDNRVYAFTVPVAPIVITNEVSLPGGAFQFGFTNVPGLSFTARSTTNVTLSFTNWAPLGRVPEISPGRKFQFHESLRPATDQPILPDQLPLESALRRRSLKRGERTELVKHRFDFRAGRPRPVFEKESETGAVAPQREMDAGVFEDPGKPHGLDALGRQALGRQGKPPRDLLQLRAAEPIAVGVVKQTHVRQARRPRRHARQGQALSQQFEQNRFHSAVALVPALRTSSRRSGLMWHTTRPSAVRISTRSNRPTDASVLT